VLRSNLVVIRSIVAQGSQKVGQQKNRHGVARRSDWVAPPLMDQFSLIARRG